MRPTRFLTAVLAATAMSGVATANLTLTGPEPGTVLTDNTWRAEGATPNGIVGFVWSPALGSTAVAGCPGVNLDLNRPRLLGWSRADGDGVVEVTLFVPGGALGRRLHFQAVDTTGCEVSNVVTHRFTQ